MDESKFILNLPSKTLMNSSVTRSTFSKIRVAVCGDLPTACNYLLKNGVVCIDKFTDATEIPDERAYHLILMYAPQAEGLLNTRYTRSTVSDEGADSIPIRLLNEPCCDSALLELGSKIRRIARQIGKDKE